MIEVPLRNAEYWVMRILGPVANQELIAKYSEDIKWGQVAVVGGDLVRPLKRFDDEEQALIAAQQFTARSGCPAKVVLNADL